MLQLQPWSCIYFYVYKRNGFCSIIISLFNDTLHYICNMYWREKPALANKYNVHNGNKMHLYRLIDSDTHI